MWGPLSRPPLSTILAGVLPQRVGDVPRKSLPKVSLFLPVGYGPLAPASLPRVFPPAFQKTVPHDFRRNEFSLIKFPVMKLALCASPCK